MEQQCWARSLCTMREAASPGTARETCKTSCLKKEAGTWPVALERVPTPMLGAVFTYLPVCGLGALGIPGIILLTELYQGAVLLLASVFTRPSLRSYSTSPFPSLTSCLS